MRVMTRAVLSTPFRFDAPIFAPFCSAAHQEKPAKSGRARTHSWTAAAAAARPLGLGRHLLGSANARARSAIGVRLPAPATHATVPAPPAAPAPPPAAGPNPHLCLLQVAGVRSRSRREAGGRRRLRWYCN